ncbi:MAG: hypothetical protein QXK33_01045 [Candidatus Bathyarchaeia archaeon]
MPLGKWKSMLGMHNDHVWKRSEKWKSLMGVCTYVQVMHGELMEGANSRRDDKTDLVIIVI